MPSLRAMTHPRLVVPLLLAVALALAAPWRGNPFFLDDLSRVLDNPGIETVFPLHRHFLDASTMSTRTGLVAYRPLLPLSLSFNHALHGYHPAGYHLTNAALHGLIAITLYLLVLELGATLSARPGTPAPGPAAAAGTALLFVLHPVGGIPIHYVCVRDLQLALLFTLVALLAHARDRRAGGSLKGTAATLGAMVLGLLAKTDAVAVPGLMLAWDLLVGSEPARARGPWLRAGAAALVAALVVAFPVLVLGSADLVNIVQGDRSLASVVGTAATQLRLHLRHYLPALLLPWRIRQAPAACAVGFDDPWSWAGLGLVVGSLVLAWRLRGPRPAAAFALAAYWIAFAPSSSLVPLHPLAVDYRALPSAAFFALLLAGSGFPLLPEPARLPAFGLLAAALVRIWIFQAGLWTSEAALWGHSLAYGGDPMAWQGLALATEDLSLRLARLDEAVARQPDYVVAHTNRGLTLVALGRVEEGLAACRRAIAIDPGRDNSHHWLGRALMLAGRPADALLAFEAALALAPGHREHRLQAAEAALALHDPGRARGLIAPLLAAGDPAPAVRAAWGRALFLEGERERAAEASLAAAQGAPEDDAFAWQAANQLLAVGRAGPAIELLAGLAARTPRHPRAHALRGFALQSLGRDPEAIEAYRAHLVRNPEDTAIRFNLATALARAGRPCAELGPVLAAVLAREPGHLGARELAKACPGP